MISNDALALIVMIGAVPVTLSIVLCVALWRRNAGSEEKQWEEINRLKERLGDARTLSAAQYVTRDELRNAINDLKEDLNNTIDRNYVRQIRAMRGGAGSEEQS